jgi:hypothetical protein
MTWSRAKAVAGSAVVTLACRIRIVRGHREPPRSRANKGFIGSCHPRCMLDPRHRSPLCKTLRDTQLRSSIVRTQLARLSKCCPQEQNFTGEQDASSRRKARHPAPADPKGWNDLVWWLWNRLPSPQNVGRRRKSRGRKPNRHSQLIRLGYRHRAQQPALSRCLAKGASDRYRVRLGRLSWRPLSLDALRDGNPNTKGNYLY